MGQLASTRSTLHTQSVQQKRDMAWPEMWHRDSAQAGLRSMQTHPPASTSQWLMHSAKTSSCPPISPHTPPPAHRCPAQRHVRSTEAHVQPHHCTSSLLRDRSVCTVTINRIADQSACSVGGCLHSQTRHVGCRTQVYKIVEAEPAPLMGTLHSGGVSVADTAERCTPAVPPPLRATAAAPTHDVGRSVKHF